MSDVAEVAGMKASLPGPHKISGIALPAHSLHIIWQRVINSLWRVCETIGHCFSFYYHFIITAACLYGRIKAGTRAAFPACAWARQWFISAWSFETRRTRAFTTLSIIARQWTRRFFKDWTKSDGSARGVLWVNDASTVCWRRNKFRRYWRFQEES